MNDYADKQRSRDAECSEAWDDFLRNCSEEERRKLKDLGINGADNPQYHISKPDDALALEQAHEVLLPAEEDKESPPPQADVLWSALRRVIGELLGNDNSRLTLECLALVSGLSYDGDSMTAIAKRHGLTRAAVSKRCVEITETLNLPPSRAMRKLTARTSYRKAQLKIRKQHESFNTRSSVQS